MRKQGMPHINFAVIGHVDAGKSTTIGHLLVNCRSFPQGVLAATEKESVIRGKPSFKYAYLLDCQSSERERGITIDVSHFDLKTQSRHFSIIDTPGHRDYIKNMITGTSRADCAILVVSSLEKEFEEGISKEGQMREHAVLAFFLGARQLIVCFNKMDLQKYSQERFRIIQKRVAEFLAKVGFRSEKVQYIPVSGWVGDNLTQKSENTPWYSGPTLLQALEKIEEPLRLQNKPFRLPIDDVYKIGGIGTVPAGIVATGILKSGMDIYFSPCNIQTSVYSIEKAHQSISKAYPGDNIGFNIRCVSWRDLKRGYVCGKYREDQPRETEDFTAEIFVLNHPNKIQAGYTPIIYCHTANLACEFAELIETYERKTKTVLEKGPKSLKNGDLALVKLKPRKPFCCETYADCPPLGRFIVRDLRQIVAVGIIRQVNKKAK